MPAGETEKFPSGWTIDTLAEHTAALRRADEKFHAERDRRYTEVAQEREKALKIKETADRDALGLAREIQTYKDEKANELRSQIERERGTYVTQAEIRGVVDKFTAELKPIAEYVTSQQGSKVGVADMRLLLFGLIAAAGTIIAIVVR